MPKRIEDVIQQNRAEIMGIPGARGISIGNKEGVRIIIVHVDTLDQKVNEKIQIIAPKLDGHTLIALRED